MIAQERCSLHAAVSLQSGCTRILAWHSQCHVSCLGREVGWSREVAQQGLEAEAAESDELHAKLISIGTEAIGGQHFPHTAPDVEARAVLAAPDKWRHESHFLSVCTSDAVCPCHRSLAAIGRPV